MARPKKGPKTPKTPANGLQNNPSAASNGGSTLDTAGTASGPSVPGRGFGTDSGRVKDNGIRNRSANLLKSMKAKKQQPPLSAQQKDHLRNIDRDLERIATMPVKTLEEKRQRIQRLAEVLFRPDISVKDVQWEALAAVAFKRLGKEDIQDVIVLAGTGVGKSLIFWLLPFILDPLEPKCVLVVTPLKLLGAEQMSGVNEQVAKGKAIVLEGANNQRSTRLAIANADYTHVFTSPEIALSRNFKKDVLSNTKFQSRLAALVLDELHLVKQWGETFRPEYKTFDRFRPRIPGIPMLGVSATVAHADLPTIRRHCGFKSNTLLLQTSLDRPNIMPCVRIMEHGADSFLDLQFILPILEALILNCWDIPKTIIYCETVAQVKALTERIRRWMRILGYPDAAQKWVQSYYSWRSQRDKEYASSGFKTVRKDLRYVGILVATDAYGMGIDNRDVERVIQWGLPKSLETMLQRMGRAGRDEGVVATFILFVPAWCRVKYKEEIDDRLKDPACTPVLRASMLLGPENRALLPKSRPYTKQRLSQVCNPKRADNEDEDDENDEDMFVAPAQAPKAGDKAPVMKKNPTERERRATMDIYLFALINTAVCLRLFFHYYFNDITYGHPFGAPDTPPKPLPLNCCHRFLQHTTDPAKEVPVEASPDDDDDDDDDDHDDEDLSEVSESDTQETPAPQPSSAEVESGTQETPAPQPSSTAAPKPSSKPVDELWNLPRACQGAIPVWWHEVQYAIEPKTSLTNKDKCGIGRRLIDLQELVQKQWRIRIRRWVAISYEEDTETRSELSDDLLEELIKTEDKSEDAIVDLLDKHSGILTEEDKEAILGAMDMIHIGGLDCHSSVLSQEDMKSIAFALDQSSAEAAIKVRGIGKDFSDTILNKLKWDTPIPEKEATPIPEKEATPVPEKEANADDADDEEDIAEKEANADDADDGEDTAEKEASAGDPGDDEDTVGIDTMGFEEYTRFKISEGIEWLDVPDLFFAVVCKN